MKFNLIAIAICLLFESSYGFQWNGNWAMNCDWVGNDFKSAKTPGEKCYSVCLQTQGCTHFSWTRYEGGTCWMKTGKTCKSKAVWNPEQGSVCGFITESCGSDPTLGGIDVGTNDGSTVNRGELLWSDEFNYAGGPNLGNWREETGGHGWGNNELQYYTNGGRNAQAANGNLVIETRRENMGNSRFTSARLISNKAFKYGIFEMRAKLPPGRGIWSAFWLLSSKRPLNWPRDGELDIMENVGFDPNVVHSTIHTGKFNHMIGTQIGKQYRVNNPHNEYHVYTMDWTPTYIKSYIDGNHYFTYNKPDSSFEAWPFDTEFNILLNVAVGGNWGGVQGVDDAVFPTKYTIDYVRHYNNGFVKV